MNKQLHMTLSFVTAISLVGMLIPQEGFAARGSYDGCYESNSICSHIQDLGEDVEDEFPNNCSAIANFSHDIQNVHSWS